MAILLGAKRKEQFNNNNCKEVLVEGNKRTTLLIKLYSIIHGKKENILTALIKGFSKPPCIYYTHVCQNIFET